MTDVALRVCSLAATQQINKRLSVEQANETTLVYVPFDLKVFTGKQRDKGRYVEQIHGAVEVPTQWHTIKNNINRTKLK